MISLNFSSSSSPFTPTGKSIQNDVTNLIPNTEDKGSQLTFNSPSKTVESQATTIKDVSKKCIYASNDSSVLTTAQENTIPVSEPSTMYRSIHNEFTLKIECFPEIFKTSRSCKNVIILKDEFKGATDIFKYLTGYSFKDTLETSSCTEMQLFDKKDLNNIESNFCYPFMRCLEMNKIIETCKDIESNIIGSNGKKKIVPAGTIFYNINELNFFKNRNLICVFNKFDKRKISLIDIDFFLPRGRDVKILDNRKKMYIDIISNFKNNLDSILFGGEILEDESKLFLEDIINTYLKTQSKSEYYNNIGLNNVIGIKGMTLSTPSLQKIDPENFSKIFTPIYKPSSGIFNIKLCDHIFNDRASRLQLGFYDDYEKKNDVNFKKELINIIENGIYLVVLNYKVYNISLGKDIKVKYLCLEMSNYHSSTDKNLSVISLITIDNLFFEHAKKLDESNFDNSRFGSDLESGNKKVTKNLKCNHIERIRPIKLGEMQVNSKFIKYSHYQSENMLIIRVYKIKSFKELKTRNISTKLVYIEECKNEIKMYKLCKSKIFEPVDKWEKLNMYEKYEKEIILSDKFPVLALVNSFSKDDNERYPKEFDIDCPDKENGLINCGVTAVNTNMIGIFKDHHLAWIM